ncbi:hypothetical protein L596_016686 [Steinernema carpocapsae]|uniref:Uncharacterized protein n=1 Tax=Steinernema carpocapsae TaxID=34508 RepID=A0A4U5NJL5_STECR|nr:hypothetical protein L596_016686 [Steinernema carpocapsae]
MDDLPIKFLEETYRLTSGVGIAYRCNIRKDLSGNYPKVSEDHLNKSVQINVAVTSNKLTCTDLTEIFNLQRKFKIWIEKWERQNRAVSYERKIKTTIWDNPELLQLLQIFNHFLKCATKTKLVTAKRSSHCLKLEICVKRKIARSCTRKTSNLIHPISPIDLLASQLENGYLNVISLRTIDSAQLELEATRLLSLKMPFISFTSFTLQVAP